MSSFSFRLQSRSRSCRPTPSRAKPRARSRRPTVGSKSASLEVTRRVVSAKVDFKSPARLDDVLTIDVRTGEINRSSFRFDFRLRQKKSNGLVARGFTTHCALDDDFKPMTVPEEYRRVIAAFEGWQD